MSFYSMSTETRLFNLVPDQDEFRKKPFVRSQKASTIVQSHQPSRIKSQSNQQQSSRISDCRSRGNRSQIESSFKLPKGFVNDMTYRKQQKQKINENPRVNSRPNTAASMNTKTKLDPEYFNVPDDASDFNEQQQQNSQQQQQFRHNALKKPPIPKKNEKPNLMRNTQNFVQKNTMGPGMMVGNMTMAQRHKIANQNEQNNQKEKENEQLKNKFGKVPGYLKNRKQEELRENLKMTQQGNKNKADMQRGAFYEIERIKNEKIRLKKEFDDVNKEYQRQFGHKTKIDLVQKVGEKEKMERKFEDLERKMNYLNRVEQQQVKVLNDNRDTPYNKDQEINMHDQFNNQKLKNKQQSKNFSQMHQFSAFKR